MTKVTYYFSFVLSCLLSFPSVAQPPNTKISTSSTVKPNEVSIAFSPKNQNELMVGANRMYMYSSLNAGSTWQESTVNSTLGERGDPVLISDSLGNFYYIHIGSDGLVCQSASGAGGAWNNGSLIVANGTKFQDKPWASIDLHNTIIYTTWTQYDTLSAALLPSDCTNVFLSRSTDHAVTWSTPKKLNAISGDCVWKDVVNPTPCLGPAGQIYVAWEDSTGILFNKSLDTGNTWMHTPVFVSTIPGQFYYKVPGIPNGRIRPDPITGCDMSQSSFRGNIYIVWSDQRNGSDNTDVFLVRSTDGGLTWSLPAKVNDDLTNTHQFFGSLTIDQSNGNLYVLFYDRRNYSNPVGTNTDVYMAQSIDGGATFANYRISQTSFLCDSTVFIGDYIGIAAQNNVIRPVWTRNDNSQTIIWTALADANSLGVNNFEPEGNFTLEANYPNPFEEETTIAFNLKSSARVTLKIIDLYGKERATMIDSRVLEAGLHTCLFENKQVQLPSGIYFYSLYDSGTTRTGKMVLLK
jgi:hypothetical protein